MQTDRGNNNVLAIWLSRRAFAILRPVNSGIDNINLDDAALPDHVAGSRHLEKQPTIADCQLCTVITHYLLTETNKEKLKTCLIAMPRYALTVCTIAEVNCTVRRSGDIPFQHIQLETCTHSARSRRQGRNGSKITHETRQCKSCM